MTKSTNTTDLLDTFSNEASAALDGPLMIAGQRIDGRTRLAQRFREIVADLHAQTGNRELSEIDAVTLRTAATLAILVEMDTAKVLNGETQSSTSLVRNLKSLNASLVLLGVRDNAREVSRKSMDAKRGDPFAASILDVTPEDDG